MLVGRRTRWWALAAALAAGVMGFAGPAPATTRASVAQGSGTDDGQSPARCGPDDTPETGIQGDVPLADQESGRAMQGYNCGLAAVGRVASAAGFGLAWSRECAYVFARGRGVDVIDVSDPSAPAAVTTLATGGGAENLHAVTTKERALLIAARAGFMVDVFDVRTCTEPELLGTIQFALGTHNIELTPDAKQVYTSLPLQVADIRDLDDPSTWEVVDVQCEVAAQTKPGFAGVFFVQTRFAEDRPECANQLAHEFGFNKSVTRMYIGGQLPASLGEAADPAHGDWESEQEFRVVDITVSPPEVISTIQGSGHGSRWTRIDGKDYVLHSNEVLGSGNGCQPEGEQPLMGVAQPFLTDVSNDRKPRTVAELGLAINSEDFCDAQTSSGVNTSVHFHEVDDANDATFAMASMNNAGVRVFDVRDPEHPVEVAYFNPGQLTAPDDGADAGIFARSNGLDRAVSHPHYDAVTGAVWITTGSGFWVLELEPQVRKALGLPKQPADYPDGRPARPPELT